MNNLAWLNIRGKITLLAAYRHINSVCKPTILDILSIFRQKTLETKHLKMFIP